MSKEGLSLDQENDRLRRAVRIHKAERHILEKASRFFARQKPRSSGLSQTIGIRFRQPDYVMSFVSQEGKADKFFLAP